NMYLIDSKGQVFWKAQTGIGNDGMDWYVYGGREGGNTAQGPRNPFGFFNRFVPRPLNPYVARPRTDKAVIEGKSIEVFHCPSDQANGWITPLLSTSPGVSCFEWVGTSYNFNANGAPNIADSTPPDPRKVAPYSGLSGEKFTHVRRPDKTIM